MLYICMPDMSGVWDLRQTLAGVVQSSLLFVVAVQAKRDVVLSFLFEHFGTLQWPTLISSTFGYSRC